MSTPASRNHGPVANLPSRYLPRNNPAVPLQPSPIPMVVVMAKPAERYSGFIFLFISVFIFFFRYLDNLKAKTLCKISYKKFPLKCLL